MIAYTRFLEGFIEHLTDEQAVILCSDRTTTTVRRSILPKIVHEGDFIMQTDDAGHIQIDKEITEMRQRALRRMSDIYFG